VTLDEFGVLRFGTSGEHDARAQLLALMEQSPIPRNEVLENLGLYLTSKDLSRLLFMDMLYRKIVEVEGIVVEFGTRWGNNLALFSQFRSIYEPFNRKRYLVGFDTFEGFLEVSAEDGTSEMMGVGNYAVSSRYEQFLTDVLSTHEQLNPLSHLHKFELRKGDASLQLREYLAEHPETIVALAYFDMDLYKPTRECLELIKPHLTRGSVLAFDEVNSPETPGETIALREVFGLGRYSIRRSAITARTCYLEVDQTST
jgi:hypothetical protein